MYTKVLFIFAFTILLVNSQFITTKRIKSSTKNAMRPKKISLNLSIAKPCNCPMDASRTPKCPCGCLNPIECKGPILNSFGCPERACKCGGCKTIGKCQCPDLPIIDSYTFIPELPLSVPSINVPSINVPISVIEVPFDYPLLCGCQGPCQCRVPEIEPTCPIIEPNYSPVITESYITDLSTYSAAPINVLVEPSCLPCGCPEPTCNCRSYNPIYEIFAPIQQCPAPVQLSCGCSGQCGCAQNVISRPLSVIDLPTCPESPKCSCGKPSCGCPVSLSPVLGCPKYLRQVTIQPPFL